MSTGSTYMPFNVYGKSNYSYTIEYSTDFGRKTYITYCDKDRHPPKEHELDVGDTKLLDEFLQGFGVK